MGDPFEFVGAETSMGLTPLVYAVYENSQRLSRALMLKCVKGGLH